MAAGSAGSEDLTSSSSWIEILRDEDVLRATWLSTDRSDEPFKLSDQEELFLTHLRTEILRACTHRRDFANVYVCKCGNGRLCYQKPCFDFWRALKLANEYKKANGLLSVSVEPSNGKIEEEDVDDLLEDADKREAFLSSATHTEATLFMFSFRW